MSAEKTNLLGLAESLVAQGKKAGASQVEVSVQDATTFTVQVREGNIERLTEAGARGLSLRVFVGQKVATASSSDLEKGTLDRLLDNAIQRAKLSGEDPFSGLPDLEKVAADPATLKIYDGAMATLDPEKKIAFAKETEKVGLSDSRIKKSMGASFSSYLGEVFLANSSGFAGSYRQSGCGCYVGLMGGEGENQIQEGWFDRSIGFGGLRSPEAIAREAIRRVTRLLGARKIESQKVPIVLEPPMTGDLLGFLSACVSGEAINQRQSFLLGKLGEKIGSDLVTVVDDGLLPGSSSTSPFDGEGVPCRRTPVVENGVLKSYLLDTYNARKLKMKSTGNAGGSTNFYMAAGKSTPEEILKSVDRGLLLTDTMGQGTVATTGDISRGAFGLWIEKGEVAYPVSEITINGNLGEILKGIVMVGNDLEFRNPTTGPTIKVAEISIGGK